MNRPLSIILFMLLCCSVTTFGADRADLAKSAAEKLDALAKTLHYPDSAYFYLSNPKTHGAQIGGTLYSGTLVTKDELKKVRAWYTKKLAFIEGMGENSAHLLMPGQTQGQLHSVQADDVVFKEPFDVATKRSASVFTLMRRTDEFIAIVVLSRAKDEDHTHIVLELIPIAD